MRTQILELLANTRESDLTISKIVGCTPSYISQLKVDPSFMQELAERQKLASPAAAKEANNSFDSLLDLVEKKALTAVANRLAVIEKPLEAARIFKILNEARRRNDETAASAITNNIVVLQLPEVIRTKLLTSANNEVVQIDDRPMVTMPSNFLLKQVTDKAKLAKDMPTKPALTELMNI